MTVSISLPEDLIEDIKEIARKEHRSFSGQVAFFLSQGVLHPDTPQNDEEDSE